MMILFGTVSVGTLLGAWLVILLVAKVARMIDETARAEERQSWNNERTELLVERQRAQVLRDALDGNFVLLSTALAELSRWDMDTTSKDVPNDRIVVVRGIVVRMHLQLLGEESDPAQPHQSPTPPSTPPVPSDLRLVMPEGPPAETSNGS